jgi:hypothetical protein
MPFRVTRQILQDEKVTANNPTQISTGTRENKKGKMKKEGRPTNKVSVLAQVSVP